MSGCKATFDMCSEYNLLADTSSVTGTETSEFSKINDEPKAAQPQKTSPWAVAAFVAGAIVLGAVAVALAPVSAGVSIGVMAAFAATAMAVNLGVQVYTNGWDNVDWGQVVISGCCGAMSAAFAMISFPVEWVIGAESIAFGRGWQGLFNGTLGAIQTTVGGGNGWQIADSFVLGFGAGWAGGAGYSYKPIQTLQFFPSIEAKKLIFGGLGKGFVFGNAAPIGGAAATQDSVPFTKKLYDGGKNLVDDRVKKLEDGFKKLFDDGNKEICTQ